MRRHGHGRFLPGVLLAVVLVASYGIRAWGSGFGLPAYTHYHPDEQALVERAVSILTTGEWDVPFNYPPFFVHVNVLAFAAHFEEGAALGKWNQVAAVPLADYYRTGRLLSAAIGTLSLFFVYLVGREMYGRTEGLLAAGLLGGCYLHVIHSHYATFDVMAGLLLCSTLLFSCLILTRKKGRWYLLAGLSAGLAGATKYNGVLALVIPLVAHVLVTPWGEWGYFNHRLFGMLGAFLLGFFGSNPFALGHLPDFLNGLAMVLYHYGTQQPGFEGRGNWRWYISVLATSADALWMLAGVFGLIGMLRDWKKGTLIACFPVVYLVTISLFVVRFERNLVPVLPFLALGGGWLLSASANALARRVKKGHIFAHGVAATGAALIIVLPVAASVSLDRALSQTDLREIAGHWVEQNVAPDSKIALEAYSIPFDRGRYQVLDVRNISDHELSWYQQQCFDVLIVSDGVWEILRLEPRIYGDRLRVYNELARSGTLLAQFVPKPPRLVVAGYPTVAVFHFAPVRIYKISQQGNCGSAP